MKANELSSKDLMVGDWVMSKELKTPVKVCSIMNHYETTIYFCCQGNEFIVNSYQLEPIPLTPEILEKNGFNDASFEAHHKYKYVIHTNEYQLGYYPKTNSFNVYKKGIDPFYSKDKFCCGFQNIVKYVHELQHALRLCKIDKEIVV